MKRLWLPLLALLGAAAIMLFLRARGPVVQVTAVARTDIERHLVASGRVRVVTRVQLTAQTAGRVTEVLHHEGQRVRTGDLLAQIDDREARAAVAEARAAVAQANGRVQQLREVSAVVTAERVREAEANFTRAQADLARTEALARAGARAANDVEEAQRARDVAAAARSAARAQQQGASAGGADLRVAEGAMTGTATAARRHRRTSRRRLIPSA